MEVDIMERGMLKLSQDILEGMVAMGVDMDMVVTDMVDMVIMCSIPHKNKALYYAALSKMHFFSKSYCYTAKSIVGFS